MMAATAPPGMATAAAEDLSKTIAAGVGAAAVAAVAAVDAVPAAPTVVVASMGADGRAGKGVFFGSVSSCFNCGCERLRRKYVFFSLLLFLLVLAWHAFLVLASYVRRIPAEHVYCHDIRGGAVATWPGPGLHPSRWWCDCVV